MCSLWRKTLPEGYYRPFPGWFLWLSVMSGLVCPATFSDDSSTPLPPRSTPFPRTTAAPDQFQPDYWRFVRETDFIYAVKQSLRAQKEVFDFKTQTWLRSAEHRETLGGECILKTVNDRSAAGSLYLQMIELIRYGQPVQITPEMGRLTRVAEFILEPSGKLLKTTDPTTRDTLLVLQILFALPRGNLKPGDTESGPFPDYTAAAHQFSNIRGTMTFGRDDHEPSEPSAPFALNCSISLISDLSSIPGRTEWSGSGLILFSETGHRLERSTWQIAKLTQTNTGEDNLPSKIIELIDLECRYQTSSDYFAVQDRR
ncbi:hypothetical protein JXA40_09985 [bacterium]|nr:hypothetical protein [candidate division CSSED10-310 bacterium]